MNNANGKSVTLVYIGRKPTKTDTVCRTGIIWDGYGDSHSVPYDIASRLRKHTDVWVTEEEFKKFPAKLPEKEVKKPNTEGHKFGPTPAELNADSDAGEDGEGGEDDGGEGDDEGDDGTGGTLGPISVVINAISSLDSDNKNHFGTTGVPKVGAVRAAADDDTITTEQVKEAWAQLNG